MKTPKISSDFFSSYEEDYDEEDDTTTTDEVEEQEEEEDDNSDSNTSDEGEDEQHDEVEEEDTEKEEVSDDDFFTTIINDQAEKGKLYYDPEKEYEGSGEEIFDEVIEDTLAKKWQDEYVAQIPEEYQSLFTALKAGKSVTEWYENTQPTDYSKLDLSGDDAQKEIIKQHLSATGLDQEDIDEQIQEYEDAGTLEKNSKKAVKYLQKSENSKAEKYEEQLEAQRKAAEKVQEEELKKFKNEVLTTEELGKRKLTKAEREKLWDHITKPVNKKGESQLVINQKSREKQLQMAYLDMIGFDFSKLEAKADTKAASGLRAKLSKTTDVNAKKNGSTARVATESNKIPGGMPWG